MSGVKFDDNKPRITLNPGASMIGQAYGMTIGAEKYSAHNWTEGMDVSRLLDAAMRHIMMFSMGEDLDPETMMNHLWHAMDSVSMAHDTLLLHPDRDDRKKLTEEQLKRVRATMEQGAKALAAFKAKKAAAQSRDALIEETPLPERVRTAKPRYQNPDYVQQNITTDLTPRGTEDRPEPKPIVLPAVTLEVPHWVRKAPGSEVLMICDRCNQEFIAANEHLKGHLECEDTRLLAYAQRMGGVK